MGDIYMTKDMGAKIMKLVICGMVAFLFLVGYVLYQSYAGRVDIINAQRDNCESAKKLQGEMAVTWRKHGEPKLAHSLVVRSHRNCETAFPKAGFLP